MSKLREILTQSQEFQHETWPRPGDFQPPAYSDCSPQIYDLGDRGLILGLFPLICDLEDRGSVALIEGNPTAGSQQA